MSTDNLPERLRRYAEVTDAYTPVITADELIEAADEIERLRAEAAHKAVERWADRRDAAEIERLRARVRQLEGEEHRLDIEVERLTDDRAKHLAAAEFRDERWKITLADRDAKIDRLTFQLQELIDKATSTDATEVAMLRQEIRDSYDANVKLQTDNAYLSGFRDQVKKMTDDAR